MILNLFTLPARLVDKGAVHTQSSDPVKIEGIWYYPVIRSTYSDDSSIDTDYKITYFQRPKTSLMDTVLFADINRQAFYMIRGYDYRMHPAGIMIPSKAEIYRTDRRGVCQQRLLKLQLK